jgi:hypothetical protein
VKIESRFRDNGRDFWLKKAYVIEKREEWRQRKTREDLTGRTWQAELSTWGP